MQEGPYSIFADLEKMTSCYIITGFSARRDQFLSQMVTQLFGVFKRA